MHNLLNQVCLKNRLHYLSKTYKQSYPLAREGYGGRIFNTSNFYGKGDKVVETLLKDYIRDVLIHYTISELAPALSFQLWNKGLTRKTTENSEAVSSSEIDDFTAKFKNRAEWYLERLIRYLIQEAGTGSKFQEYINPGSRVDTFVPKRTSFEIGIYLGNTDVNRKEMPKWYKYEFLSCCR